MEVRPHDSVDEFRAIAEPLYRRDPVMHTIELTLLGANKFPEDKLLLTVWNNGAPVGAALTDATIPIGVRWDSRRRHGRGCSAARRVAPWLTGVRGVRSSAVAFADAWQTITGRAGTISTEERLYRLGTLRSPNGVTGAARLGTDDDRGQLVEWVELFFRETFSQRDEAAAERFVDPANQVGDRFVVWDVNGTPVSMAMLRAPAADVSRIGPVFTPRNRRGHGYGSAVTAAAADLAHRSGTPDVVLFADLANPVSNAIYQRIGFEPVADSVRIDFGTLG